MALKSVIKKLTGARAKYDAQLAKLGSKTAKEVAKEIGALLPDGFALKWIQGTPSFNDGEPCTFRVHDPEFIRVEENEEEEDDFEDEVDTNEGEGTDTNDETEDEEEPDDEPEAVSYPEEMDLETVIDRYGKPDQKSKYGDYIDEGYPKIPGYPAKTLKDLGKLWRSLPPDLLEAAFGDGAEVTVYADGKFTNDIYYK